MNKSIRTNYKVGIELETLIPYYNFDHDPNDTGMLVLERLQSENVVLKGDGSISEIPNHSGVELNTEPVAFGGRFINYVGLISDILSSVEAKVNKSCGFHVHISHEIDFDDPRNIRCYLFYATTITL